MEIEAAGRDRFAFEALFAARKRWWAYRARTRSEAERTARDIGAEVAARVEEVKTQGVSQDTLEQFKNNLSV